MNTKHSYFLDKTNSIFFSIFNECGFSDTSIIDENTVRFKTQASFIEIRRFCSHDPNVFFTNISFGQIDKNSRTGLDDLIHCTEPKLPLNEIQIKTESRNFPATSNAEIDSSLLKLAELVKPYLPFIMKWVKE